eukprot:9136650-Pyramimonas_sp.AAC.1
MAQLWTPSPRWKNRCRIWNSSSTGRPASCGLETFGDQLLAIALKRLASHDHAGRSTVAHRLRWVDLGRDVDVTY